MKKSTCTFSPVKRWLDYPSALPECCEADIIGDHEIGMKGAVKRALMFFLIYKESKYVRKNIA